MNIILLFLAAIGRPVITALANIGRVARFVGTALWRAVTPPCYFRQWGEQIFAIGYLSLPVIGLTALFTGAALAQQVYIGGNRFNAEATVPAVVIIAIVRELGPVLAGLMLAGRVASAMAAELGTMRVTEQIDALITLRTDPYRYLIAPRLVAATLVMPFLVLVADIIGVMGGFLLSTTQLGFSSTNYLEMTRRFLEVQDVVSSLLKAAIFGFIIAAMGCYHGLRATSGAAGVGRVTTSAVVSAFILILLSNLIITVIVFNTP